MVPQIDSSYNKHRHSSRHDNNYNNDAGERALRMAPLYVALMIVMSIPMILLSVSEATLASPSSSSSSPHQIRQRDSQPGGVWLPSEKPTELSNNNQRRSSSSSTSRQNPPQVQVQTPLARCELHQVDNQEQILVLEPTYSQVLVAVVDKETGDWLIQTLQSDTSDTFALPSDDNTRTKRYWTPLVGRLDWNDPDDTTTSTSPWQVAQQTVHAAIGILDETHDHKDQTNRRRALTGFDQDGLPSGQIPAGHNNNNNKEQDWTFLGRHRTMARHGGGFVYSYLYHGKLTRQQQQQLMGRPQTTNLMRLSRAEIQTGLQTGSFVDLGATTTISLAFLQLQQQKETKADKEKENR